MVAKAVRELPEQTGRSLEAWSALLEREVPGAPFAARHEHLMRAHDLDHGRARTIVHLIDYVYRPPDDELVAAQYAGAKAALRPIYDAVIEATLGLGDDVKVEPRKTYVTLARRRQFGLVQATRRDRVDVGLRLDRAPPGGRLAAAGSFGSSSITHRVGLTTVGDVDPELRAWLGEAYAGGA